MRILFVNQRAAPFGGVEQNVRMTATALRRRGHQCALAYEPGVGEVAPGYLADFDAAFACSDIASRPGGVTGAPLGELATRFGADVIYLHKLDRLPAPALLPRVPVIRMVHDHDLCCPRSHKYYALSGRVCTKPAGWRCYLDGAFLDRRPSALFGIGLRSIGRRLREMRRNRNLDALIAGSRFMRDELVMNGFPADRVHILAPSVPEPAPMMPMPSMAATSRTVLYVGQLVRGKGVDMLLRALAQLDEGVRAVIVGKGNHDAELRALSAQLGLDARVEFHGWCDHRALGAFYRQARVVAFPARWPEPFGMVGLEAMHHARPVVAFDAGGVCDWLDHERTGLLVPAGDVGRYAAALRQVLDDPALALRMGAAAKLRAAEHFAFDRYVDQLESVLRTTRPSAALRRSA